MRVNFSRKRQAAGIALAILAWPWADAVAAEIRDLPVPAATILPNTIITVAQIRPRSFRVTSTSVAGFATVESEILGKQARRRLIAGKPIPLASLTLPFAIRRGTIAAALYHDEGFTISISLVALADGAAGDMIEARNIETGTVVLARVRADGSLTVESP
jgi:flagellar basal body P-ring formation protein FlgA